MILLYVECGWEKDYILRYLLNQIQFTNYFVITICQMTQSFLHRLSKMSDDFVFVFSSNNMTYQTASVIVNYLKPKIVIHNSDEWGNRPEYLELSKSTPLMLMQYAYYYEVPKNVYHLPVGYLTGVHLGGIPSWGDAKPSIDRTYDWSFVGTLKSDRRVAIKSFMNGWDNATYFAKPNNVTNLANIYKNSKFVISPRGNTSLLCFRTFEAITCGAIPVVSGCTRQELERTYNFQNKVIPFIHAETWDQAVQICKNMKNLEEVRKKCIEWYTSINDTIMSQIHQVIAN